MLVVVVWHADGVLGGAQHGQLPAAQCQVTQRRDQPRRRHRPVQRHHQHRQKPQLRRTARLPRTRQCSSCIVRLFIFVHQSTS